jgi:hypothetical protein
MIFNATEEQVLSLRHFILAPGFWRIEILGECVTIDNGKGVQTMTSKKRFILFLFQFPITLLVGILLTFGYSIRVHDQPGVDWPVAITLGIVIDVVMTVLNKRDERRHQHL